MIETTSVGREAAFKQERDALERRQQDRRNSDNTKLREQRLKALEDAKTAIAEKHRAAAETALRAELEVAFLASPAASEEDFAAAYPQLRREHLNREAIAAPEREKSALRRGSGNRYNF